MIVVFDITHRDSFPTTVLSRCVGRMVMFSVAFDASVLGFSFGGDVIYVISVGSVVMLRTTELVGWVCTTVLVS